MKILFKSLKYFSFLIVVWFLAHTIYIVIDGLSDRQQKADIAVILGSKVNEDGTLSERLK